MYLALRVTGTSSGRSFSTHHGPSISMLGLAPVGGTLTAGAGLGNIAVIIVGLLAIIRDQRAAAPAPRF